MRFPLRSLPTAVAAALLLAAGTASADPSPRECIAAADRGQSLQHQHKLTFAREALRVCAAPTCPTEVQRACIGWLDAADKAQPTLAFSVTDANGNDLPDVKVTVDDTPFVSKIMGTAVEIDPGEHTFHFTSPGYEPLTRKVVIVEGEKTRRVKVILEKIGGAAVVAPVPRRSGASGALPDDSVAETTAPPDHSGTAQSTAGIIVLAAGGAAVGTGVGFLIDYVINKSNESTDSQNDYGTHSSQNITNPCLVPTKVTPQTTDGCKAQNNAQTAEIAMIATFAGGGALGILGITLIATAHTSTASKTTGLLPDLRLVPSVGPGRGSLFVVGRF